MPTKNSTASAIWTASSNKIAAKEERRFPWGKPAPFYGVKAACALVQRSLRALEQRADFAGDTTVRLILQIRSAVSARSAARRAVCNSSRSQWGSATFRAGQAMLTLPEKVAGTTQFQILLRDLESVVGFRHGPQARFGIFAAGVGE